MSARRAFRAQLVNVTFFTLFLQVRLFIVPHVSAQDIEDEAVSLIDGSFQTLRSSTAAFNMLLKFKHVRSREAINNHLGRKFDDVLVQFCKEVLCCEGQMSGLSGCP